MMDGSVALSVSTKQFLPSLQLVEVKLEQTFLFDLLLLFLNLFVKIE
jgi:hypothetical protein